jgi:hypothetical protein
MDTYKKIDLGIKFFCLIGIAVTFVMFIAFKDEMYEDNDKARKEFSLNIVLNAEDKIGTGLNCAYFLADMSEDELKQLFSFDELTTDLISKILQLGEANMPDEARWWPQRRVDATEASQDGNAG